MRQNMPTRPRDGKTSSVGSAWEVRAVALIIVRLSGSFVVPIRIVRMLQVPEWPTALHLWQRLEVILRWRGGRRPLQRPGVPRIIPCRWPLAQGTYDIPHKEEHRQRLKSDPNGRQ